MTNTKYSQKDEQAFIRAIRSNNYRHLELADDLALITDVEPNEGFYPFISVENDVYDEKIIAEYLAELDWLEWSNLEIQDEQGINFDFCEIYDAEFNDPAISSEEIES